MDQKQFYLQLNGIRREKVVPSASESVRFWSGIWSSAVQHNRNVQCLSEVKESKYERQGEVNIDVVQVKKQSSKILNWKMPGLEDIGSSTLRQVMRGLQSSLMVYCMERRSLTGSRVATLC